MAAGRFFASGHRPKARETAAGLSKLSRIVEVAGIRISCAKGLRNRRANDAIAMKLISTLAETFSSVHNKNLLRRRVWQEMKSSMSGTRRWKLQRNERGDC